MVRIIRRGSRVVRDRESSRDDDVTSVDLALAMSTRRARAVVELASRALGARARASMAMPGAERARASARSAARSDAGAARREIRGVSRGFASDAAEGASTKTHPDGLPRYPELSVAGALRAADYLGTGAFAMTGSLLAASSGMDAFGCTVIGTITAVGGGTIRDVLLGQGRRAFWMEEQEYLWIAAGAALATFFGWERAKQAYGLADDDYWIEALDALGVGAFCVIGAQNGIRAGVPVIAQVLCGVMTATFGGAVRDVFVGRPTRILHSYSDIYATAAAGGALAYITARGVGLPPPLRVIAGVGVGVGMRVAADTYDIRLPVYSSAKARETAAAKGDKRWS